MSCQLYRHFDVKDELLYVGISLSAVNRLSQHRDHSHWFKDIVRQTVEHFDSRQEALDAERTAIEEENPKYNVQKRKKEALSTYEIARKEIMHQILLKPLYSVDDAAKLLGLRPGTVVNMVLDDGLGCVKIPQKREGWQPKMMITGWQIIDYFEQKDK